MSLLKKEKKILRVEKMDDPFFHKNAVNQQMWSMEAVKYQKFSPVTYFWMYSLLHISKTSCIFKGK